MAIRTILAAALMCLAAPAAADQTTSPEIATSFHVGSAVQIEWHGSYWPGRVTALVSDGRFVVSYDGYNQSHDELVDASRLRPKRTPAHIASSEETELAVLVLWHRHWYPAHIIYTADNGSSKISYDGYGSEWDEFVPASRIRSR